MTEYVVGFLFDRTKVVLIRKSHPEWQRGKLNGVGGHIEPGETLQEAMAREFQEEAGHATDPADWEHCVTLRHHSRDGIVHFLRSHSSEAVMLEYGEDEPCGWFNTSDMPGNILPNLRWLLPLMQDNNIRFPVEIDDDSSITDEDTPPGPAHATPDDDDEMDALDRRAAEAMGWRDFTTWWGVRGGVSPDGRTLKLPRPTRDPGDAMRLLLHMLDRCPDSYARICARYIVLNGVEKTYEMKPNPLIAITRACVAALEAIAAASGGGEAEGEAGNGP